MFIDNDRIAAILDARHSYYPAREVQTREDARWNLGWMTDLMVRNLSPTARVLDVGCGNGQILMELCSSFQTGLGIDHDPEFLQMAEEAKRRDGIRNVDLLLLDYPREAGRLPPESFDMVICLRGPVPESDEGMRAAHRVLVPDGLLFCQEIAELHHIEEAELFWDRAPDRRKVRRGEEVRSLMERNGFEVRLVADIITKAYFPDLYAWLEYVSNIWSWLELPFPAADDPRFALFAEQNTVATGEVVTTNHVAWVAGVKA